MIDNLLFEQVQVSPHIHQFLTDYLFTHQKLLSVGINPKMDCGMGECDLTLAIVNDAYNHEHISEKQSSEFMMIGEVCKECELEGVATPDDNS